MENIKNGFWPKIIIGAIIIVATAGAFIKLEFLNVTSKKYQAIFMNNGQVYFGKLSAKNEPWIILEDIYYLQTMSTQSGDSSNSQTPTNINLVKLGSELHGPTNRMEINRLNVMFIEELRDDSNIIMAIGKLENQ